MNNKILGLDIGDQWVGISISDNTKTFAHPLTTVKFSELEQYLKNIILKENIDEIVIGNPITMKGSMSLQTHKVHEHKSKLEKLFPNFKFTLWDERLTSKWAQSLKPAKTKEDKLKSHSIAASFILDSYLSYLKFKSEISEE